LQVGYGAGPYYGLWSPEESLTEIRSLQMEYESEIGKHNSPSSSFPFSIDDVQSIERKIASGDKSPWIEWDWPCNGCLPICHHGCTFWSVLILVGELVGSIWDVACFAGYSGEWLPAQRPSGWWEFGVTSRLLPPLPTPPTFMEWYTGWLERGLTDLTDSERNRS
jgi:hypothetical protein